MDPPDEHCMPSASAFRRLAASSVRRRTIGSGFGWPRTGGRASDMCELYQEVAFRMATNRIRTMDR